MNRYVTILRWRQCESILVPVFGPDVLARDRKEVRLLLRFTPLPRRINRSKIQVGLMVDDYRTEGLIEEFLYN